MPNWISITVETLNEAKLAALISACSTIAKAEDQPDRASGLIQGVVDEIRRKVASNALNRVDTDLTKIPKGLRDLAVDLIIARLKLAIEEPLLDDERAALTRHERTLNRIAEGRDVIDQPDEPVAPQVETASGGDWGSAEKINTRFP